MYRLLGSFLIVVLGTTMLAPDAGAISRVGRSLNFLEVYGSKSKPVGELEFVNVVGSSEDFDAEDLYDPTYSFGLGLGQVRSGQLAWALGLRYTKHQLDDDIGDYFTDTEGLSFNQYDLELSINYYFADVAASAFSPYVGLGLAAGLMSPHYEESNEDFDSEAKALAGLNFGFDLRLAQRPDGSQFSLVSANRYDIMATSERPRYLNIGLALRYYVRP